MKLPITIDPRYHDAVLFDLDGALTDDVPLLRGDGRPGAKAAGHRRRRGGVFVEPALSAGLESRRGRRSVRRLHRRNRRRTRDVPNKPDPAVLLEATRRLGVRPQRCVVVENSGAGVAAGRDGGFALVIGIDGAGHADDLARAVPTS